MTDLTSFVTMLAKSGEEFSKRKCGEDWNVVITGRDIEFHFRKDESFWFAANNRYTK
jgi:hypothetical protein